MNSSKTIRNYKHDISGKFKDITTAINTLDEKSFEDDDNNEIFHAVHEVLLKMVKTSRNTILENLKQEIILVVSDNEPNVSLSKLQIEGVTIRYELMTKSTVYFLFLNENKGNPAFLLGNVFAVLPIKKIRNEVENKEIHRLIECLSSSEKA